MSMDPEEAVYEEGLHQLYLDHKEQAIDEFIKERMESYFIDNPELSHPARDLLGDAKKTRDICARASLVFCAAAAEVCLKQTILYPIVYGLVHDESSAKFITDIVIRTRQTDYQQLLFKIVNYVGGIDLNSAICFHDPIIKEYKKIQEIRNNIVHKGFYTSADEVELAMKVAEYFIHEVFPSVVRHPLFVDDALTICDANKLRHKHFIGRLKEK